jgi:predicted TIM-barrel fold metal-dependent hydrolase
LKDQDIDGIEAEVLFSSPTRQLYSIIEEPLQRAIFTSYNLWLHEFCSYDPKRLIGLATISILNMDHTVKDIFRYAKLGFCGVQIPTRIRDSGYYDPLYEPMWATTRMGSPRGPIPKKPWIATAPASIQLSS